MSAWVTIKFVDLGCAYAVAGDEKCLFPPFWDFYAPPRAPEIEPNDMLGRYLQRDACTGRYVHRVVTASGRYL